VTNVAGGQQAPRKCCLSSSTQRIRGSPLFGSRRFSCPGRAIAAVFYDGLHWRRRTVVCAEVFALVAECLLFWWAFIRPLPRNTVATIRDCLAITAANAASVIAGALFWP
jgi:hypothetical protein